MVDTLEKPDTFYPMSKMSKEKGKRGEREFAAVLRSFGFEARRGQQFSGGDDSPDVVCPSLPSIHFEVKRVEKVNLPVAYIQAAADGVGKAPVVVTRKNGGEWMAYLTATDLLLILQRLENLSKLAGCTSKEQ